MSKLFQNSINTAHSFHRLLKKTDLGETKFNAWNGLSKAILSNAYAVYKDTHDNAGRSVKTVDEATAKTHRDALFASLNAMADTVGEVAFSDKNSAKLTVDADLAATIGAFCTMQGWDYNDVVKDIDNQIADARIELKYAQEHFDRYNFNGVEESAKAQAEEKLNAAEQKLEDLKTKRKTEVDKKDAKTPVRIPNDEKKFRLALENLVWDMINNQTAMTYEQYRETRRAANKAKRERRKAAKEAAEKKYADA